METHHNKQSDNIDILNKGFAILDTTFKQYGWYNTKNEMNFISYTKSGDETSYIDIQILPDAIMTSVPIKYSRYQYNKSFNNYYLATEYLEQKIIDYSK
jgi:hypothetical protein